MKNLRFLLRDTTNIEKVKNIIKITKDLKLKSVINLALNLLIQEMGESFIKIKKSNNLSRS